MPEECVVNNLKMKKMGGFANVRMADFGELTNFAMQFGIFKVESVQLEY